MPKMYSLAIKYGFIVPNKVLTEDRQKISPEKLLLLFRYVDAEKMFVINFAFFPSNSPSNIFEHVPSRVIWGFWSE